MSMVMPMATRPDKQRKVLRVLPDVFAAYDLVSRSGNIYRYKKQPKPIVGEEAARAWLLETIRKTPPPNT